MTGLRIPSDHAAAGLAASAMYPAAEIWGRRMLVGVLLAWSLSLITGYEAGLAAMVLLGFAAAALGVTRPALGLFGVGILCVVDASARVFLLSGGWLRWNTLNYWLLGVTLLFLPFVLQVRSGPTRLVIALLGLLALEVLPSPEPTRGALHVLDGAAVLGLTIYATRAAVEPRVWYWLGLVCGTAGAYGGLVFLLSVDGWAAINPNAWSFLGVASLFTLCFALARAPQDGAPVAPLLLLAGANAAWVFLSGSRGNMLISACALLFATAAVRGAARRMLLVGVMVAVGLLLSSHFGGFEERAVHRLRLLADRRASLAIRTSGRSDIALGAVAIFWQHPLGIGTGAFAPTLRALGRVEGTARMRWKEQDAHSAWLKVGVENGAPGLLLLVAYVASFTVSGWTSGRRSLRRLGMLISVSLSVAWLSTEFQNKGLWLLAAGGATLLSGTRAAHGRRDAERADA